MYIYLFSVPSFYPFVCFVSTSFYLLSPSSLLSLCLYFLLFVLFLSLPPLTQTIKSLSSSINKLKDSLSSVAKAAAIKPQPANRSYKERPNPSSPTTPPTSLQQQADQLRIEVHMYTYYYISLSFLFLIFPFTKYFILYMILYVVTCVHSLMLSLIKLTLKFNF